MENAFTLASRKKLRFNTSRGQLSAEDLWDLNLKSLDNIGQSVITELKPGAGSLLENPDPKTNAAQVDNEIRLEIIKAVIGVKQEENKASLAAAGNRRRKEMLQQILETKKIDQLGDKSIEELQAEIAALG